MEADLRRRIESGEWQSGEAPSGVPTLAAEYDVARATVSRCMDAAARIGPRSDTHSSVVVYLPAWMTTGGSPCRMTTGLPFSSKPVTTRFMDALPRWPVCMHHHERDERSAFNAA